MTEEEEKQLLKEYLKVATKTHKVGTDAKQAQMQIYGAIALFIALSVLSYFEVYFPMTAGYVFGAIVGYLFLLARNIGSSGSEIAVISKYLDRDLVEKRINELSA